MHHCNIMYPSCDTIYTGVMLNVEIPRSLRLCVSPVPSLDDRISNDDSRYSIKLITSLRLMILICSSCVCAPVTIVLRMRVLDVRVYRIILYYTRSRI